MVQTPTLFSLRNKLFLAFFLLTTFIIAAISYTLFSHMQTNHLDTLKRELKVIAGMAALKMQGGIIESHIKGNEAAYTELHLQLRQIKALSSEIEKVYILQITNPLTSHLLIADALEPQEEDIHLGEAFPLPPETSLHALLAGPTVTGTIARATGDTIHAFAPLRNEQGIPVALLGIVVDAAQVSEDIRHFLAQVLGIGLGATIIVTLISWILARNFSRRLSLLDTALDRIATGDLNISLAVEGNDEVSLLATRINQVATVICREREDMLLAAIESLVAALEAKDPYTYGHSSQVSTMAAAMARQMKLSEIDLFQIRIAALLHDIGKIGIPDQVLNKPGVLDAAERKAIEQHTVIGAKILAGISALSQVTEIVRHHHARWDGTGYPESLAGTAIPLGARIIAVADTFQAMTSDRTYRKGLSATIALYELKRCSGTQFDPEVVAAFEKIDYETPDKLMTATLISLLGDDRLQEDAAAVERDF